MNLRQITYFIAVAEELSFRAAAQRLNVSQPPVSIQIRELEAELGVRLFDRSTQKVALTDAGAVFLRRARAIARSLEDARDEIAAMAGSGGVLRLGYMSSAMLYTLSPILARLRAMSGRMTLGLHQMPPDDQLRAVARGEIDAGFVDFSAGRGRVWVGDETLHLQTVWHESLVATLPPDHPKAAATALSPAELVGEPLIVLPRNPFFGFYDHVIEQLSQATRRPLTLIEARDLPQVLALVAAGCGVSITPRHSSRIWQDRVRFVPFEPGMRTEVCLIHRADIDPAHAVRLREAAAGADLP